MSLANNKSYIVHANFQVILPAFNQIRSFPCFHRSHQKSNFTDIDKVGVGLTHELTKTDMTQLEGAFRNCTFAPNKQIISHGGHNKHT